jgi:hypothetical protein
MKIMVCVMKLIREKLCFSEIEHGNNVTRIVLRAFFNGLSEKCNGGDKIIFVMVSVVAKKSAVPLVC